MYCHQCGKEVESGVKFCPYCGAQMDAAQSTQTTQGGYQPLNQQGSYQQQANYVREDDAPSGGFAVLSFFVPIIGLVLYIVWNKEYPQKAKSCLKGIIAGVVLYVVAFCCMFSAMGFIASESYNDYSDDYYFNAVVETVPYE